MTNPKALSNTPAPLSWLENIDNSPSINCELGKSLLNSDRNSLGFGLSIEKMKDFNRRRTEMISRKKIINLFIRYYINEDRNSVRTLLSTPASSSDFSDDLSALDRSITIDREIVKKKEKDGSIDALKKRQGYVMRERIDAINERLQLGGHSLLTEKETLLIYKNWPSIYQLVRESIEEHAGSENTTPSTFLSATSEFLQ